MQDTTGIQEYREFRQHVRQTVVDQTQVVQRMSKALCLLGLIGMAGYATAQYASQFLQHWLITACSRLEVGGGGMVLLVLGMYISWTRFAKPRPSLYRNMVQAGLSFLEQRGFNETTIDMIEQWANARLIDWAPVGYSSERTLNSAMLQAIARLQIPETQPLGASTQVTICPHCGGSITAS